MCGHWMAPVRVRAASYSAEGPQPGSAILNSL